MHTSPMELDRFDFHRVLRPYTNLDTTTLISSPRSNRVTVVTQKAKPLPPVEVIQQQWTSFTVVRGPHLRVLAAFDQFVHAGLHEEWGRACAGVERAKLGLCSAKRPPRSFDAFMRWLERGLDSRKLAWCCTPLLVHFRPATMYTHWPGGVEASQAVSVIQKLEELHGDMPHLMRRLLPNASSDLIVRLDAGANSRSGSAARAPLCKHQRGCQPHELEALIDTTAHTLETLQATERLYSRDFDLLGYDRLGLPPPLPHAATRTAPDEL